MNWLQTHCEAKGVLCYHPQTIKIKVVYHYARLSSDFEGEKVLQRVSARQS